MTYFVIYENPSDFPGKFVLRRHKDNYAKGLVGVAKEPDAVADTLHEARQKLPGCVFNIGRHPQDDAAIKEVWI